MKGAFFSLFGGSSRERSALLSYSVFPMEDAALNTLIDRYLQSIEFSTVLKPSVPVPIKVLSSSLFPCPGVAASSANFVICPSCSIPLGFRSEREETPSCSGEVISLSTGCWYASYKLFGRTSLSKFSLSHMGDAWASCLPCFKGGFISEICSPGLAYFK